MLTAAQKILFSLFFLIYVQAFAQSVYDPEILVLAPGKTVYDKKYFKREIDSTNVQIYYYLKQKAGEAKVPDTSLPANIQRIEESTRAFEKELDLFKQVSFIAHEYLSYRFYEHFPNLLTLLTPDTSKGDLKSLHTLYEKHGLQYILSFPSIQLVRRNDRSFAEIHILLYDGHDGKLLLDSTFIGDSHNPGFEFSCNEGTLQCCFSNALAPALNRIVRIVAENSPQVKRTRRIAESRSEVLHSYLNKPYPANLVREAVPAGDSAINLNALYQVLSNEDKTAFIAFFLEPSAVKDFKQLHDGNMDKSVKIETSKPITDSSFLDEMPSCYAYIVKAVRYKGQWYYEKDKATYFNVRTQASAQEQYFNVLQQIGFFVDDTSLTDSLFWEKKLVDPVKDLKQDPNWPKYGTTIWQSEEVNNRPYIGMPAIVAEEKRREDKAAREELQERLARQYLEPLVEKLEKSGQYETVRLNQMRAEYLILYPFDTSVFLFPVRVKEAGKPPYLRYFVLLPAEKRCKLYEWTCLESKRPADEHGSANFLDEINTLTLWNYSIDAVDDAHFWQEYVLKKKNGKYLYLQEVKE